MADSKDAHKPLGGKQLVATDGHARNQEVVKVYSAPAVVRLVHRVVEKSFRRLRQLLLCPVNHHRCDRLALCSGQKEQGHSEEQLSAVAAAWSPPSTVLIVHISNSTLVDCVIGGESRPPPVVEQQPLMHRAVQDLDDPDGGSWSPPSIHINNSNLSWVILGNNNYMSVEQTVPSEEERVEEQVEDGEDGDGSVSEAT